MISMSQQPLTISQVATYVGVTVRAVRHYHALGLLPEPPRDGSGYRRYGADAIIKLTRIKTLADAGVPLSKIESLTQASPDSFATAIDAIKADIAERIAELTAAKERLDTLQSGDRLFVSGAVANYLHYLRHIGLSEALISHERDAWILISALYPDYVDIWAEQKQLVLKRPLVARLYRCLDEARKWPVDDPRLAALAKDMAHISNHQKAPPFPGQEKLASNAQALELISGFGTGTFPSWQHLQNMVEKLAAKK